MQLYQLSFPNGKKYIGITSQTAKERFKHHCKPSQKKYPCQNAIHKYGKENVVLTVLATVNNWELLCLAEIEAIEKINTIAPNGYNLTLGGDGRFTVSLCSGDRVAREKAREAKKREVKKLKLKGSIDLYQKKYRENNKEKLREWRDKNKDDISEKQRKYQKENREKMNDLQRLYNLKNKEHINKKRREARAKLKITSN